MNDKEFDEFIKQSLDQDIPKQEDLDREIIHRFENGMNDKTKKRMRLGKRKNVLPRVAAIVLAVLVLGGGSVYAAGQALKKIYISKHYIAVGDECTDEFMNDLEEKWDDDHQFRTAEESQEFYPTSEDVWTLKIISHYNSIGEDGKSTHMTTTTYAYPDYETALKEAAKDNNIFEPLYREYPYPLIYSLPDWLCLLPDRSVYVKYDFSQIDYFPEGELGTNLSVSHSYHRGWVFFSQSLHSKFWQSCIFDLGETSNVRTYTTQEGVEFTLVDVDVAGCQIIDGFNVSAGLPSGPKETAVVFNRGDEVVSMHFIDLSDEEIGEILELIKM